MAGSSPGPFEVARVRCVCAHERRDARACRVKAPLSPDSVLAWLTEWEAAAGEAEEQIQPTKAEPNAPRVAAEALRATFERSWSQVVDASFETAGRVAMRDCQELRRRNAHTARCESSLDLDWCAKVGSVTATSARPRSLHCMSNVAPFTPDRLGTLRDLRFDNAFVRELPADAQPDNRRRQVHGALFSLVEPTAVAQPKLIAYSSEVARMVGSEHVRDRKRRVRRSVWRQSLDRRYAAVRGELWRSSVRHVGRAVG